MDNIKFYEEDGFELEFESDTSPEEQTYYAQEYKNVDLVVNKRNHCTSCNAHIGTSPSAEDNIQTHAVLGVTQCVKCYRFYNNNGEFEIGEDGSECYCRWCGQGGQLYCCSACPYVFCKKCIKRNLSSDGLKEVLSNDNWKCYACAPKILYPLRARHWALVNFIKKQKKALNSKIIKGLRDPDEIADHMKKDESICCRPKTTAKKRQRPIGSDKEDKDWFKLIYSKNLNRSSSIQKKKVKTDETLKKALKKEIKSEAFPSPSVSKSRTPRNKAKLSQVKKSRPRKIVTANSNTPVSNEPSTEIACTPELYSYFLDRSPETSGGQNYRATTTTKPRKRKTSATSNRKNVIINAVIDVDRYRIDLNPPAMPLLVVKNPLPQQMMHQFGMAAPTQAMQRQARCSINAPVTNAIQQPKVPCIPNTKVGRARAQLESQMFNAMEICQQIDGKVKKLMDSIAYKTANKMTDIKDLYIHLSYLLTYTSGRVQSLQDKCMEDMRQLHFENAVSSLSSGKFIDKNGSDCDEDEIVEDSLSHAIITIDDSDEEEERSPAKKTSSENDVVCLSTSIDNLECIVDISAILQLDGEGDHLNDAEESLLAGKIDDAERIPTPPSLVDHVDVKDDMKFKSNVKIVLKRVDDENKTDDDEQCVSEIEKTSNNDIERHMPSDAAVKNVENSKASEDAVEQSNADKKGKQ